MINPESAFFIEVRYCDGSIKPNFFGQRHFCPASGEDEWPRYRVMGPDKDKCIDELIAKLHSLKEHQESICQSTM